MPAVTDAYLPAQVAVRVRDVGVTKATAPSADLLALAILAGAFIALGAVFYTVTMTVGAGAKPSAGIGRLVGGLAFSLGLILVVVGGAELFTGNNLIAMAWASRQISTRQLLRNWVIVYAGNFIGALGTVGLVFFAGLDRMEDGTVGETMVRIARGKVDVDSLSLVARGILCNVLVCLAVWLCMAARSVTDKVLAIVFPITAFVTCGLEHSVANMYFLPLGAALTAGSASPIGLSAILYNLTLVTLGNLLGGTLLVASVYWFVYLRNASSQRTA